MKLLLRSNDPVLLSFVQSLLRDAGIAFVLADSSMSVLEGSIGILPRRILVPDEAWHRGSKLLADAELGQWVVRDDGT